MRGEIIFQDTQKHIMSITYQEYTEMALERIAQGKLPKNYKLMTEQELKDFLAPVEETPPLREQRDFVLASKLMYKRMRRLIEKGDSPDKEKMLAEVDTMYQEALALFGERT